RRVLLALAGAAALVSLAWAETSRSWIQSLAFSRLAGASTWTISSDSTALSLALRAPDGPYDARHGYARIPEFRERLEARGFVVRSQAVPSPDLTRLPGWGLCPIYREKGSAGLDVLGKEGDPVFRARYPDNLFASFEDIPPVMRDAL